MLKNYFTIAGRDVGKHKSYALINAVGLAFGICACIVSFLVSDSKFSLDNFDRDSNRFYRFVSTMQSNFGPNARAFKDQIPGLEATGGFITYGGSISIPRADELVKTIDHNNLCNRR